MEPTGDDVLVGVSVTNAYFGRMKARHVPRPIWIVFVLLIVLVPSGLFAQDASGGESETLAEWIDRTNLHRISGYVTLGLTTATAIMGAFESEYHYLVAGPTAVAATVTVALGSIAYRDRLSRFWPHSLMAGLATAGMFTNLFFLEGGSQAHIATGIASTALLYGAYASVLLLQ